MVGGGVEREPRQTGEPGSLPSPLLFPSGLLPQGPLRKPLREQDRYWLNVAPLFEAKPQGAEGGAKRIRGSHCQSQSLDDQAEIPFHPPASPAGTGLCWPEKRLRTLGVTDRAMIKGKGSEGRGQTAKEGPALPEAVPRALR